MFYGKEAIREAVLQFFPQKLIRIPSNVRRNFALTYLLNSEKVKGWKKLLCIRVRLYSPWNEQLEMNLGISRNFAKFIELNEVNI